MAKLTTTEELASFARGEITYGDLSDEANKALAGAEKTEKQKKDLEQLKKAKRTGAIAAVSADVLKSVFAIAQTVTGIKGLKAPIPPAPPERDPQLLERLRTAKLEAEQPVTPAMQRAREAQAVEAAGRGRATARAATAGQLGLYAPLAQATNLGILKQMRAGVAEDEALRTQKQQIFDRLLQQRAGETRGIQQAKQRGFYQYEYPEFQAQRRGYQRLGQAGLTGMLDILGGIPQIATAFAAGRRTPEGRESRQLERTPFTEYGFAPLQQGYSPLPQLLPEEDISYGGQPLSPEQRPQPTPYLFPEEQPEYFSPYSIK